MTCSALRVSLATACCAAGVSLASPSAQADTPAIGNTPVGPSFACPTPRDPLGQIICSSHLLSRTDLAFVQAYQALRQQSPPEGQKALRVQAAEFGRAVRADCGIGTPAGPHDPPPETPPPSAASCVEAEYDRQRSTWVGQLTGAAQQEAARPLDQQVELQRDLVSIGLLPKADAVDGVYGTGTRAAIVAFQQTMGLPVTGLIGDTDATALSRQAMLHATPQTAPSPVAVPPPRSPWDDFASEAVAMGVKVSTATEPSCVVTFDVRNPVALAAATQAYAQSIGADLPNGQGPQLFEAEMRFLRSQFAARGVHALYATHPTGVDICRFEARAYSADIYGRDVAQPLFGFTFDKATYDKVVWDRFDADNLPRIMSAFAYGSYARERLHLPAEVGTHDAAVTPAAPAAQPTPSLSPVPSGQPSFSPSIRTEQAALSSHLAVDAPASRPQAGGEIVRWSGSSTMTTRPFHVDGPWELQWTSGGFLSMTLHRMDSDETKMVAMATERSASSSFQPNGGTFFLEVATGDPWTAKVIGLPNVSQGTTNQSQAGQKPFMTGDHPIASLVKAEGDQSDLPPCDTDEAGKDLAHTIEGSPMGQTLHVQVLHVRGEARHQTTDGSTVCSALVTTNAGQDEAFVYQFYRMDGEVFIKAQPAD